MARPTRRTNRSWYFRGRVNGAKGADIASAETITLGNDGNYFDITGTTAIKYITTAGWKAGAMVTLQFDGSVTVHHDEGTIPSGAAEILLASAGDLSATADDTLTLVYDGVTWREVARTVI